LPQPAQSRNAKARFDAFEIDLCSGELRRDGKPIALQEKPLQLLLALVENSGVLVTREELRNRLWPSDNYGSFDDGLNTAIRKLRQALNDSAEAPRFIETIPKRGYRFVAAVEIIPLPVPESVWSRSSIRWGAVACAIALTIGLAVGTKLFFSRKAHALTDKDTILIADFTNTTGDPVFDGTLRQGLAVQLEQSPFLSLVSDELIQKDLRLMEQPPDARLTPQIALDLCQRTQSAVVIDGSIASLGSQYVLGLKAVNCSTGDSLAQEQATADDKEHVLKALGEAAAKLRGKLGESLSTIEKYDTPLEEATTSSLEALQAFSLGWQGLVGVGPADSSDPVPLFKRAIKLDPNFAKAYWALGMTYGNMGESTLAGENFRKAYELREHASEREKLFIEAAYSDSVTGDLEKGKRAYEALAQMYPRDWGPRNLLGYIYGTYGQYDKALVEYREAFRLNSEPELISDNIINMYLSLNRLEEARATAEERLAKEIDSSASHYFLYQIAFLQNDQAGMAQQMAWAAGKPLAEDMFLAFDCDTALHAGQLAKARVLYLRVIGAEKRAEHKEAAADYEAYEGLREAFFGNEAVARHQARAALALSTGRHVQFLAALTLAVVGEEAQAQELADDLGKRFPEGTVVHFEYLPPIEAQLALNRKDSSKAIELLEPVGPYELAVVEDIYVRGNAYLAAHKGNEAAAEFQKILDHRGIVVNDSIGALAHLQLGRAYVLQGDRAKARAAYQDFLTLWKNADPDIPILIGAKAEYAKLK
jgi:DNA-binding winged helix-turn-helix (wHTH) protein/Flp pilus assembly protein TadD